MQIRLVAERQSVLCAGAADIYNGQRQISVLRRKEEAKGILNTLKVFNFYEFIQLMTGVTCD